jgi:hypothetical protein
MLNYQEPPNGDFVAFVEKIEREQLARALQPHKLQDASAGGRSVARESVGADPRPQSASEAQQALRAQAGASRPAPTAALIGAAIGAALIAFGTMAEGGIFLALVGALLLWHNVRKVWRSTVSAAAGAAAAQQIDRTFGGQPSKFTRQRKG